MLETLTFDAGCKPKNKRARKRQRQAMQAALAQYAEVQRLGQVIQALDLIRSYVLDQQLRMARELAVAGAPMQGVVWVEPAEGGA